MADFVANDSHEFIVIHDVHQRGENAHATVRACKGVDVDYMVYFKNSKVFHRHPLYPR